MLSGLLRKLKSLLGFGKEDESADQKPESDYECAVCGTPVADPEGECPLCRSSDVVAADGTNSGERAETDAADGPLSGGPTESRSPGTADEAAERLRELREEQGQERQDDA